MKQPHLQQFPKTSTERIPDNRPLPLEEAPICKSTPWPEAGKISENLFEERKDWLLPPNHLNNNIKGTASVTSPKPPIKEEPKTEEQPSTDPKTEKCGWGPNCPFCNNQEEEDWNGDCQRQLQQQLQPQQKVQMAQTKFPQTLNYQKPQRFDQRHLMAGTQAKKRSASSGKQKWKDLMLNII